MQSEDVWLAATVIKRREISVPNTEITLKSFDVRFMRTEAFTDNESSTVEESVKADRLRILADKDGNVIGSEHMTSSSADDDSSTNAASSGTSLPKGGLLSQSGK